MMERPLKDEVIIHWSSDDGAFIAKILKLPGCAADGATPQEVLATFEPVAGELIATVRELGRSVPGPKGRLLFA